MKQIIPLYIFLLIAIPLTFRAQNYRYVHTLFPGSVKTTGIIYGAAPFLNYPYINEAATTVQNLVMDLYQPQNDTLTSRPAIIFAHPGGFVSGNRTVEDMVAFCDTFARKGYVTATIDYRKGLEVLDNADLHYQRGAYRGIQDGRTAVRFLRANATQYGIDPDKVYFAGSSAGAFIAINSVTLDATELPVYVGPVSYTAFFQNYTGPSLGDPDIGANLGYNGTPDGIMGLWGGVDDTLKIGINNSAPMFLVHGTADETVPFSSGPPFGFASLADVFGSQSISLRLASIGIPAADTYFVEGVGHEFHGASNGMWENGTGGNQYWDTIVEKSTTFFWQVHKPSAAFSITANAMQISFNDLSTGATGWKWSFGDGGSSIEQNPAHTYSTEGTYLVSLYIRNNNQSWDTISQSIIVLDNTSSGEALAGDIRIYPVPANGRVTIESSKPLSIENIKVYNSSGKEQPISITNNGNHSNLDVTGWKPGVYILKMLVAGEIIIRKLMIN
ncbi:MAG: T9SS type A sorting domain-containing protein [Bacteroidales bacterium]|nr:T9SS type A sorting domain-containing protein [Bacteroidales bacterium]